MIQDCDLYEPPATAISAEKAQAELEGGYCQIDLTSNTICDCLRSAGVIRLTFVGALPHSSQPDSL